MTLRIVALILSLAAAGPATAADCPAPSVQDSQAAADRISRLRAQAGLGPVGADPALTAAAARQACAMARRGQLTHAGGGGVGARARQAGYPASLAAENIGAGQRDLGAAMDSWVASAPHRANLLNGRIRHVGVAQAIAADGRTRFWSLVMAAPR